MSTARPPAHLYPTSSTLRRAARVLVAALALFSFGTVARAGALEDGQAAYEAMDYGSAASSLSAAAGDPALTSTQRAQALLLLGIVRLTLGEQDLAHQHFVDAVTLDPALAIPPDLSPKVRELIERARGQVRAQPPLAPTAAVVAPPATEPAPAPTSSASPPATTGVDGDETIVWSSPWLWGGIAVVAVAAAVVGAVAIVLALTSEEPPPDDPAGDCDAPDGSGCVKVTF